MRIGMAAVVLAGVALASCGGGGSGGSGAVPVTSGPSATPTSTPTGTPSPTPAAYPTYAQLTGDQQFKTDCAAVRFDSSPPAVLPVTAFGAGLTLSYAAATGTYTVAPDFTQTGLFGPNARPYTQAERDNAAPAGVISFARTTNGFQERLSIGTNTSAGATPNYVRGFSLRVPLNGNTGVNPPAVQYSCIFGVPTRLDDEPRGGGVITFTRTGLNGSANVYPVGSAPESYAITKSQVTLSVDLSTYLVTTTVHVIGNQLSASGTSAVDVDLGTYSGSVTIDEAGFYNGLLTSNDRGVRFASFGGWFFGPQGAEAAYSIGIQSLDQANGRQLSLIGNAIALR